MCSSANQLPTGIASALSAALELVVIIIIRFNLSVAIHQEEYVIESRIGRVMSRDIYIYLLLLLLLLLQEYGLFNHLLVASYLTFLMNLNFIESFYYSSKRMVNC